MSTTVAFRAKTNSKLTQSLKELLEAKAPTRSADLLFSFIELFKEHGKSQDDSVAAHFLTCLKPNKRYKEFIILQNENSGEGVMLAFEGKFGEGVMSALCETVPNILFCGEYGFGFPNSSHEPFYFLPRTYRRKKLITDLSYIQDLHDDQNYEPWLKTCSFPPWLVLALLKWLKVFRQPVVLTLEKKTGRKEAKLDLSKSSLEVIQEESGTRLDSLLFESTVIWKEGKKTKFITEGLSALPKFKICGNCKSKTNLKVCVCKKIRYCSKNCQREDWGTHKKTCTKER